MVFISICRALYDYTPQGDNELAIEEGELLYILEKSTEDDWWKAKKKPPGEDDDEPVGLIPYNYVQEASPSHHAKALYDYSRQTDEELSFSEDVRLAVYDSSDPDWTLVGCDGEYGFAPANYIEVLGESQESPAAEEPGPTLPARNSQPATAGKPASSASPTSKPAPAYLGEIQSRIASKPADQATAASPVPSATREPPQVQYTPDDSEDDIPAPSLPQRPPSQQATPQTQYAAPLSPDSEGVAPSPPYNRVVSQSKNDSQPSPGGFQMYHISEMVSAIGKNKKLPTTLGLNIGTGTIMIAPEKSRDGPQQEWTAEKLTHYSIEGKHVFMELVRPSKSVDFHAGNKDTAIAIVAGLGEIAGAARAEGLREILEISGTVQRRGRMLYEFLAQQDDEVTVDADDEVIILDDTKSDEWWVVRSVKNGKEGVVPSSYVESIATTTTDASTNTLNAGKSLKEQNRLEEERLAKEAVQRSKSHKKSDSRGFEVGPGLKLPNRGSSLTSRADDDSGLSQRNKRDGKPEGKSSSKTKPDTSKTRTWTDRSGSFKVDAQFLGLKDGKIHLHKLNGVKIAVPVGKMAVEDLEYVERVTGQSLDDEKPLSDIRRRSTQLKKGEAPKRDTRSPGASIGPSRSTSKGSDYDWFDFFLKAGVSPYQCQRYTDNFDKDSMDDTILPDITAPVLRTLGLKEGDILRVMKYLDTKFGRTGTSARARGILGGEADGKDEEVANAGGLFSGPGGTLHNNTRKGRPAPTVQTNNSVNADTFKQPDEQNNAGPAVSKSATTLPGPPTPPKDIGSFDDDAWNVKPLKQAPTQAAAQLPSTLPASTVVPPPPPTGALAELSLLTPPLHPTPSLPKQAPQQQAPTQAASAQQAPAAVASPIQVQPQPTGANPAFFTQLNPQATPAPQNQAAPVPIYNTQPPMAAPQQHTAPRQRPQPPAMPQQSSFLPPPPRPLSAPQNAPQNHAFGPPALMPQLTGYQPNQVSQASLAPQGRSLDELSALRRQELVYQSQPQYAPQAGLQAQNQDFARLNGIHPHPTGFPHPQFQQQPTGFPTPSPFTGMAYANGSVHAQPTGFQPLMPQATSYNPQLQGSLQPQPTGINSVLPPALQPQQTGINGVGGRSEFGQPPMPAPPLPPIPQQATAQPLVPQKTGPAPPVSFGANKLVPQPTGRRAKLSQATPENPFGF